MRVELPIADLKFGTFRSTGPEIGHVSMGDADLRLAAKFAMG
jgi:hypothetical protein